MEAGIMRSGSGQQTMGMEELQSASVHSVRLSPLRSLAGENVYSVQACSRYDLTMFESIRTRANAVDDL